MNTSTQNQAQIIQEVLFDNQQKIPDGDYLKMMNALQQIVKDNPVSQTIRARMLPTTTTTTTRRQDNPHEPTWGQWRTRAREAQRQLGVITGTPPEFAPRQQWRERALEMERLLREISRPRFSQESTQESTFERLLQDEEENPNEYVSSLLSEVQTLRAQNLVVREENRTLREDLVNQATEHQRAVNTMINNLMGIARGESNQ